LRENKIFDVGNWPHAIALISVPPIAAQRLIYVLFAGLWKRRRRPASLWPCQAKYYRPPYPHAWASDREQNPQPKSSDFVHWNDFRWDLALVWRNRQSVWRSSGRRPSRSDRGRRWYYPWGRWLLQSLRELSLQWRTISHSALQRRIRWIHRQNMRQEKLL